MGRLIEETELEKYIMHDGCEKGCGYIDERDLKYIPTVEAIPKDQYETRLKADLGAILEEIRERLIKEMILYGEHGEHDIENGIGIARKLIKQKIDKLRRTTMTNLTLEVCIKEYLQDHNFHDLLQLATDIYREISNLQEVEDGKID